MPGVELSVVRIDKPEEAQVIIGHAGFIKTAEDLYEALAGSVPGIKFGIAFNEASGPRLVRLEGNDDTLVDMAGRNALRIGAGHTFVILVLDAYPINVSNAIKGVSEVSNVFCATANAVSVIVASTGNGTSVIGVVDGSDAVALEKEYDKAERRAFLRKIGYKLK